VHDFLRYFLETVGFSHILLIAKVPQVLQLAVDHGERAIQGLRRILHGFAE
jgi:hypothetical protein